MIQKTVALILAALFMLTARSQNILKAVLKNNDTKEPIAAVTIILQSTKTGVSTNNKGFAELKNIPDGLQTITFSHTGFKPLTDSFSFPLAGSDTVEVLLEIEKEELDEVIIQSTRTSRTIKNTATRVETIDGEELDEKNNMRPGNVSMLLHESTGLQVQQTSATSGNASIRVQGLDGKYTQLLKDGYPNFGNFASGLSILEIPPLDLKQIEVIKGPASTLYGGGAIAGVVNFISKLPNPEFEGDFILNQSNIGQTNIGGYISEKKRKTGYAVLGLVNFQKAYDVDNDEFAEIPKANSFTISPRLFYYPDPSTTFMIGNSLTKGTNTGGDIDVINGKADSNHTYFEKNSTFRNTSVFEFDKKFTNKNSIKLKQSFSIFDRKISSPAYSFAGANTNSFTDISIAFVKQKHTMITGGNFISDRFIQKNGSTQDAQTSTAGTYFQDSWDITEKVKLESGIRLDYVRYKNNNYSKNQTFVLPRVSALFRITDKITSRVGGGLGYKTPTLFTEQTERMLYQNISPLNNVTSERSIGGTVDINYKTGLVSGLLFSINQLFFYTGIHKPLVLQQGTAGNYFFSNNSSPVTSKGFETNMKFIFKGYLKLFVGYTYTNAWATYLKGNQFLPLVPKSKLNLTLMYEKENNFKLGLESYFTGHQYLYNGTKTPPFREFGFAAQKTFGHLSLFINFENFTDERQSKYKTVVNPPHNNPTFDDIWNHTEGFVVNGGVKIKF